MEASLVRTGTGYATERDTVKSAASARTIHPDVMHPGTLASLRALKARQAADRLAAGRAWEDTGLVVADALGRGIHPEVYAQRWRALCRGAGLPPIRLHAIRHTLATALHSAGIALGSAASLLGHTPATHMAFYVQRTESGAASAEAALGTLLAASQ